MTASKPTIFVGSSSEGLPIAKALRSALSGDAAVTVWHEGVFGLGDGTLEVLVAATKRFDFAALVLTPDDLLTSRGKRHQTARDNVLFEAGLFMGTLGRHRTFLVFDRRRPLKIPSDLAGITLASFGNRESSDDPHVQVRTAADQIREAIGKLGPLRPPPSPFWSPFLSASCRIVIGRFDGFADFEASGMIGLGDAACLTEVASSLRARFGIDPVMRFADRFDGDELSHDLILIGGPDANSITHEVVKRLQTSIKFGDVKINEVAFRSPLTGARFVPSRNEAGDISVDYGVVIRAPNPFAPTRKVLALFGCFGFGTWAAGRLVCSEEFIETESAASGTDVEIIVQTTVAREVPQQPSICELRRLADLPGRPNVT